MFIQAGLLHDRIGGVARKDFTIHRDMSLGDRAVPNFMVPFTIAHPVTAVGFENLLYCGGRNRPSVMNRDGRFAMGD